MNIATALYFICYIPELYANYKNSNANIYNLPEKILVFVGTSFAFTYSIIINDNSLIINYGPILILDFSALAMRGYYVYKSHTRIQTNCERISTDAASQTSESHSITEEDIEATALTVDSV